jgi:acetyl-CoA C-acetyltransferase
MHWNRRAAIVGVGRTHSTTRRPDVNQAEMINEAVNAALEDAGLTMKDIDLNLVGDMELFQGDYASDMWHVSGLGGNMASGMRMITGGCTGGMLVCSAACFSSSGLHDVVMAVGWQKHDEGSATTGLNAAEDPLWEGWFQGGTGGGGGFAVPFIRAVGDECAQRIAAILRSQISECASKNPYAHVRKVYTPEDVMNSPWLSYPMRLLHVCPQSTGAACVIVAAEERAKEISKKPVWIKDFVTSHQEGFWADSTMLGGCMGKNSTWYDAAKKLYKRNNITDPLKQIDLFEMYNPNVWVTMECLQNTLMLEIEDMFEKIESGYFHGLTGEFPLNPSGGVLATNAIGASAMLRTLEAAVQIRGDGGPFQTQKEINVAMASSFGGCGWNTLTLLTKSIDD